MLSVRGIGIVSPNATQGTAHMLQTHLTELLGLKIPVLQAPMGGVAGPGLVEAVCSAGALGMLPIWPLPVDVATSVVREVKARVSSPFAVNLNVAFDPTAMLELALDHAVPVVHFFWGDPSPYVARAKSRGAKVMATVGSIEEGKRAAKAGVDVLVAQGIEAGGHVWGKTSLFALLPALADACPDCPIVAA